jgi:hypothetical protein
MNARAICRLCHRFQFIAWSAIAVAAAGGVALAVTSLITIATGYLS